MKRALVKNWITGAGLEAWIFLVSGEYHCGYVQVPSGVASIDDDLIDLIDLKVEINYSKSPEWANNQEVIGYDCANWDEWCDVDFCTKECEKLASYLVSIAGAAKRDIKTR